MSNRKVELSALSRNESAQLTGPVFLWEGRSSWRVFVLQ
jgi:hypothetical protein